MKKIELNLQKKLLIVEPNSSDEKQFFKTWKNNTFYKGQEILFICKGSELTNEIAKEFIPLNPIEHPKAFFISYTRFLNAFVDVVEKNGFYWGENPIEEPIMHQLLGADIKPNSEEKEWQEAESRTFKAEKTLIFEILL